MKKRIALLNRILNLGNKPDTPFIDSYKNLMFNLFLLLATPFAFLVFLVNVFTQEYVLAALNFLQLIIFTIGFWVSTTQRKIFLRAYLMLLNAIISIVAAYFFKNGSEYRLLVMVVAAIVIFDRKWQYILFVALISISFVAIRLDDLPLSEMSVLSIVEIIVKILLPLIFFILCLYYFKYLYFKNQISLEKAYQDLSISKNEKERILKVVAHDLRTPITGIAGISKLMHSDTSVNAEQKELLTMIEDAATTSLNMIKELLDSTIIDIDKERLKDIEINKYIQQNLQLLAFTAQEKNITLQATYLSKPVHIKFDPELIDRVIGNLVTNAIKFSKPGSEINISLSVEEPYLVIAVKDQGIGIPAGYQERVFDMFTTAKRKGTDGEKSFGLGLSICKQIITLHGGTISFTSEPDKGTSFYVRLPL
ncbi:MAG: HAMP domain-containing histidine kinase [Sediminibacterium sp.]|nr:HAMP domain-containing histidine kinase [Sediminibacterium sp.]